MPKKTGRLSQIMGQSASQIGDLSDRAAREQYNYLRKVIREREKGFAKAGRQGAFDRQYGIMGPPSLRGLSEAQVKKQLGRMVEQLSGRSATITGYKIGLELNARHRATALMSKFKELNPSESAARDLGRFLGEMQSRYGDMWKHVSDDFIEILDNPEYAEQVLQDREKMADSAFFEHEAERLNLEAKQFQRNFEYWRAHTKELAKAKAIKRRGGKGKLYPSSYIKQLGLEPISEWEAGRNDS